jgi:hypothetical protein
MHWNYCRLKLKMSHYTPRRRLVGEEYRSYSFSTSAVDGSEWSASRPGCGLAPGKGPPGAHCTGGWVGPRAGLGTEAKGKSFRFCRGSNLDRPVVQPVARHCTDCATRFPFLGLDILRNKYHFQRCERPTAS